MLIPFYWNLRYTSRSRFSPVAVLVSIVCFHEHQLGIVQRVWFPVRVERKRFMRLWAGQLDLAKQMLLSVHSH
jgi:hypothetical protein